VNDGNLIGHKPEFDNGGVQLDGIENSFANRTRQAGSSVVIDFASYGLITPEGLQHNHLSAADFPL
jgi:hypothetical protein